MDKHKTEYKTICGKGTKEFDKLCNDLKHEDSFWTPTTDLFILYIPGDANGSFLYQQWSRPAKPRQL